MRKITVKNNEHNIIQHLYFFFKSATTSFTTLSLQINV